MNIYIIPRDFVHCEDRNVSTIIDTNISLRIAYDDLSDFSEFTEHSKDTEDKKKVTYKLTNGKLNERQMIKRIDFFL